MLALSLRPEGLVASHVLAANKPTTGGWVVLRRRNKVATLVALSSAMGSVMPRPQAEAGPNMLSRATCLPMKARARAASARSVRACRRKVSLKSDAAM